MSSLTVEGLNVMTKICTKCKSEKPTSEFHKCPSRRDGLHSWCKPCARDAAKNKRLANKLKNAHGIDMSGTKVCSQCHEEKEKTEFHVSLYSRDGLNSCCKECKSYYTRARVERNLRANEESDIQCEGIRVIEKHCHACGETKPAGDFYRSATQKDGLHTYCKKCASSQMKSYRKRQSE